MSDMCQVSGCSRPANHSQAHNALAALEEAIERLERNNIETVDLRRVADTVRKATR